MRRVGIQPKATFIVALTALILSMAPAAAELWPQRPVRIVVPIAAGSSPDVAARVFAQHLAARWGSTVVVENRPGGDGVIGTTTFATVHDDHALLFTGAAPISVYPLIQENCPTIPHVTYCRSPSRLKHSARFRFRRRCRSSRCPISLVLRVRGPVSSIGQPGAARFQF